MPTNDLIQSFVARYRREYDFYYEVARLVAQRCEELSAENGIRGIVTFRAKRPDRLEAKLSRRDEDKHYQSEEDIRSDIVDLSGVRIALYFPSDRTKIAALLSEAFVVDEVKEYRGKPKTNSRQGSCTKFR
jgi:ppGpp synthetase/RelA/SpoT-type nucleotidyltranferase